MTLVLEETHVDEDVMGHRQNDTDGRKTEIRAKKMNLSRCHFVNHKTHIDWPGIEPRPPP
jgi:hypothetical protein